MLAVIDNYDSFTYNVVLQLSQFEKDIQVFRNDAISPEALEALNPKQIVISPGPSSPLEAGVSLAMLAHFAGKVPILGICLGHQAIGHFFGAKVEASGAPAHGKVCHIAHDAKGIFKGLPQGFQAARYHSLVVDPVSVPECLEVSATYNEIVMGLRHKHLPNVEGVQFHPESFLTECGSQMIRNFLELASTKDGENVA